MDDDLRTIVHNAIAEAMSTNEAVMLGPWVFTASTLNEDGQRVVWVLTGPDTIGYEAKGLLVEATDRIREDGLAHAWYASDDDEDES